MCVFVRLYIYIFDTHTQGVFFIESGAVTFTHEEAPEDDAMVWGENMFFASLSVLCPEDSVPRKPARVTVPSSGLNFPATIYTLGVQAFRELAATNPALRRRFASATCVYACMHVCMYVCMYVSMYVCIYVCIYVCM